MTQLVEDYLQLITDTLSFVKKQMGTRPPVQKKVAPITVAKPTPKPIPVEPPKVEVKKVAPVVNKTPKKSASPKRENWAVGETSRIVDDSMNDLKELLRRIAPHFMLQDGIVDDTLARKRANEWKYKTQAAPITIFFFQEKAQERKLLENIAKAIDIYFVPTRLISAEEIEKGKAWETFFSSDDLKLIIACDYRICQLKGLMSFYKEIPSSSETFLNEIPLFMLPDLSLYLKNPLLKSSLWKALCAKITKLLPSS